MLHDLCNYGFVLNLTDDFPLDEFYFIKLMMNGYS